MFFIFCVLLFFVCFNVDTESRFSIKNYRDFIVFILSCCVCLSDVSWSCAYCCLLDFYQVNSTLFKYKKCFFYCIILKL